MFLIRKRRKTDNFETTTNLVVLEKYFKHFNIFKEIIRSFNIFLADIVLAPPFLSDMSVKNVSFF